LWYNGLSHPPTVLEKGENSVTTEIEAQAHLVVAAPLIVGICAILLSSPALAQTSHRTHALPKIHAATLPFGLKGDVLGETIQDFRNRNRRVIHTPPGDPLPAMKQLPVCTGDPLSSQEDSLPSDVDESTESDEERRAGVIKCVAALSADDDIDFDVPGPTVAGISAYETVYSFFRGRLYEIESQIPRSDYVQLRTALKEKYGHPSREILDYQNAFGANSLGERLAWHNAASSIYLGQLDGESNNSKLIFWHDSLRKECAASGASNSPGKDL